MPAFADPTQDPLAALRDIHLPPDPSWWPPAPGWWLLAAVLLTLLIALALWWRRRHRRLAWQRAAIAEVHQLQQDYEQHGDALAFLEGLNTVLKRSALRRHRTPAAALHGAAWIDFLNRQHPGKPFIDSDAELLGRARYAGTAEAVDAALAGRVEQWLRGQR